MGLNALYLMSFDDTFDVTSNQGLLDHFDETSDVQRWHVLTCFPCFGKEQGRLSLDHLFTGIHNR